MKRSPAKSIEIGFISASLSLTGLCQASAGGMDPDSVPPAYSPSPFTQAHIIDPISNKLDAPVDKWSQVAVMAVQLSAFIDPNSNGQLSSEDKKTIAMIGMLTDAAKNTIKGVVTNAVAIKPAY